MSYYLFTAGGTLSLLTAHEYKTHNGAMRALYGYGYVVMLENGDVVALHTANVRQLQTNAEADGSQWYGTVPFRPRGNLEAYARPGKALVDFGRRLTPDEITDSVSAWRDAGPDLLKVLNDVIADGFRKPKPYRVFYDAGVYEWYENTGRAGLWEYRKRGKCVGSYNARAKMCAKHV